MKLLYTSETDRVSIFAKCGPRLFTFRTGGAVRPIEFANFTRDYIIFDPFQTASFEHKTGGPKYIMETLCAYLCDRAVTRISTFPVPAGCCHMVSDAKQLRDAAAGVNGPSWLIPVGEDPRSVIPVLRAGLLRRRRRVLLPLMHIPKPPLKRKGALLRNALYWSWIQILLILHSLSLIHVLTINYYTFLQVSGKRHRETTYLLPPPAIEARGSSPAKSGEATLVFLGRMVPHKGLLELPPILRLVRKRLGNSVSVLMAGNISEHDKRKFLNACSREGVSDMVSILGDITDVQKEQLLTEAFVLLLPSFEEGYSYVIAESVMRGIPVVCWDLPELAAVWGQHHLVRRVREGDQNKFATAVVHALGEADGFAE